MSANKRLMKKLEEVSRCEMKNFDNIQVDEAILLIWQGLVVLGSPPDKLASGEKNQLSTQDHI
ncbi:Ubiquitin-conjugating enzyme E2 L3 [Cricetulus griseus]|uniref:Ubiquitin-conjugating enzyme E2 L3 n=1 Tax=Cricetulus griseus TaxID=10029 RepID=G3H2H0_CRIGR|nr:Ubiquitin-conjugating enzyme E2 L3 [Cricetulus griseus]